MLFIPLNVCFLQMVRLEGVKGNAKVKLPERRRHIETSMRDGTILPATQGIKFIRRSFAGDCFALDLIAIRALGPISDRDILSRHHTHKPHHSWLIICERANCKIGIDGVF